MLLQTPHGNILWDLIALLDDDTVEFVRQKCKAIFVLSLLVDLVRLIPREVSMPL